MNRFYLEGEIRYSKEKSKFYGVGNDAPEDRETNYSIDRVKYYAELVRNGLLPSFLKSGFVLELSQDKVHDFPQRAELNNRAYYGEQGGTNTGFGVVLLFDRRDNIFYPTKRWYYKVLANIYGRTLGGIFTYNNFIFDFRHYFDLMDENIIALQFYANFTDGKPPFYNLPALSDDKHMRGYFEGSYRDQQYLTGQIEYRKIV